MLTKQIAETTNGLTIQASRDVHLIQEGLSFEAVERLVHLLLENNFPKLQEEAAKIARQSVDKLIHETYDKLANKIENISTEKLADPGVQYTIYEAIKSVARKGDKSPIELLAELLELRMEKNNTDILDIFIDEAVAIAPKLTYKMICTLVTIQFVQHLEVPTPLQLEPMYKIVYEEYTSKCSEVTETQLMTIASIGAGNYMRMMGTNTFIDFKKKYPILNCEDATTRFPFVLATLNTYDKLQLHKLSLNGPGRVIALKLLGKQFPSINLKDFVT